MFPKLTRMEVVFSLEMISEFRFQYLPNLSELINFKFVWY